MATISASDFTTIMNITISAEHAEAILDGAIDLLNVFDAQLSNLSGDAGSKTVTVTSKQRGGVFVIARMIYYDYYQGITNMSAEGYSVSKTQLMSNPTVMAFVETIATRLQVAEDDRIPFIVATDESGIS